ncbi:hypothetical protein [Ureibacillus sinduriensis]|uniref:Uncharacterized protein n=1 Tax=Ureibacillus sinduriensis BLB-1 = JCM 15800 TaxID=1384057 RepID=A0A0A3I830_9BACL|nr:hypothetical protein [Ureibacillus sinduriensis]KGR79670.1 hypothetical protein CD33_00370 [Ureibacillus sinduriensis BLB-1 = JCM 15800]
MKRTLMSLGTIFSIIFGAGFLIRFMRDGDFYIANFVGVCIGIILLMGSLFTKKNNTNDSISIDNG